MFYLGILPLRERYYDLLTAVSKDGTEAEGAILKTAYSEESHDLYHQDIGTTV